MKNILLIPVIIFLNFSVCISGKYYIPSTIIPSCSAGIFYHNLSSVNDFLLSNNVSGLSPERASFLGLQMKTNDLAFLSDDFKYLLFSLNLLLPIGSPRSGIEKYSDLKTYAFFLELSTFESYIKVVTVHPVVGFGISYSSLALDSRGNTIMFLENLNKEPGIYHLEKFTALFKLGGGGNLRINLSEKNKEAINLLISFETSYSINLDALKFYDGSWFLGDHNINDIEDYYAPAFMIELRIGIEM
jgi:hypothetical protein